ncbi:hypothetical protein HMPREF1548_00449 [Clostridium sp. KLE 1755]|nr:hypothetical protein HMPREF1548_00449 [Clostridium sp. KLE 1755]
MHIRIRKPKKISVSRRKRFFEKRWLLEDMLILLRKSLNIIY